MMEYKEDSQGLSVSGETFDYLWFMRGYSLLMDTHMMVQYTPERNGSWVYLVSIEPEDLRQKIESDIRTLADEGTLKRVW